MPKQKNWKVLREFDVGFWKRGFVVEDEAANRNVIIKALNERNHESHPYQYRHGAWCAEWRDNRLSLQEFLSDEELKFKTLAETFLNLSHKNVAQVYEISSDDQGCPVVVMEYFFGEPIVNELAGAPLGVVIAHFKQLLEGIAFIHDLGNLYLHVTKQFILSDIAAGETKIMNWWQTRKKGEPLTRHENFAVYYLAPEMIYGGGITELTDLYSVAALMHHVWVGKAPYARSFLPRVLADQLKEEDDIDPNGILKDPGDKSELKFCELISQLLRKNPGDRGFKNARDVINYIVKTWPDAARPAKELYGGVMTTMTI